MISGILVLLFLLVGVSPFAYKMATTSLWNDELYTIRQFSARGVITSLTDYHAPNNHILFNFLNALLPGSASVEPYRARLLSFVACLAGSLALLGYFSRRSRFLEGTLVATAVFGPGLLMLALQARGYGLNTLFSILASLSVVEYFRRPSARAVLVLSLTTVLGTWTVPTFLLFAGPLMVYAFLGSRDPRLLRAGVMAALGVAVLYLPLREELLEHSQSFSRLWGRRYASFDSVARTLQRFLLSQKSWLVFLAFTGSLLAPGLLTDRDSPLGKSLRVLTLAVVSFFAGCLWLETPLVRTTAFVVVPIVLVLVLSLGELYRDSHWFCIRPVVGVAAVLVAAALTTSRLSSFSFKPLETWKETADTLELVFPADLSVHCDFRPRWLAAYLPAEYQLEDKLDEERFAAGRQIHVNTGRDLEEKARLKQAAGTHALLSFPEHYGEEQLILFHPPLSSGIESVVADGQEVNLLAVTDRSRATSWSTPYPGTDGPIEIRAQLDSQPDYRSLVVLWGKNGAPARIEVAVHSEPPAERHRPVRVLSQNGILIVPLGGIPVSAVEIRAWPPPAGTSLAIDELWIYSTENSESLAPMPRTTRLRS